MPQSNVLRRLADFNGRLLQNLGVGVKASLLRPIELDSVRASWFQIAALLVLTLLPPLIAQLCTVGVGGEFSADGLTAIFFPFSVIFLLAVVAAKLLGVNEKIAAIVLVLVSAGIFIDIVSYSLFYALKYIPQGNRVLFYLNYFPVYWLSATFAVLLLRLDFINTARKWAVAVPAALALSLVLNNVWQDQTLWGEPYSEEQANKKAEDYYAAVTEKVIYRQPTLLAEHLHKLKPGNPAATDLYFLGVAGDAQQGVFMREIRSVAATMLQRFASADHSLLLVNHRDTLNTEPIATVTSITAGIKKIGAIMDKENDILFIYLTSHGSQEHALSLQFFPMQLRDLTPADLRRILDEAGVEWRVIVVSACYSGGFIEPLANDKTVIITAAAADKTSFGCSDENDFTYFGRAYFEQGLSKTDSFIDAFDVAKANVTQRELAESQEPSNPQISVGKDIRAKLDEFEKTLH